MSFQRPWQLGLISILAIREIRLYQMKMVGPLLENRKSGTVHAKATCNFLSFAANMFYTYDFAT